MPINHTASEELVTTARVSTERPERYSKQLIAHLSRRTVGKWDAETRTGTITFDDGAGVAHLTCEPGTLTITLRSATELVPGFEFVIGKHLVWFGARDELVVKWVRADGSPGTIHSHETLAAQDQSGA